FPCTTLLRSQVALRVHVGDHVAETAYHPGPFGHIVPGHVVFPGLMRDLEIVQQLRGDVSAGGASIRDVHADDPLTGGMEVPRSWPGKGAGIGGLLRGPTRRPRPRRCGTGAP